MDWINQYRIKKKLRMPPTVYSHRIILLVILWSFVVPSAGQTVGIGTSIFTPGSMLSIDGNMAIGNTYRSASAPANGLISQSNVGIGTSSVGAMLNIIDDQNKGFRFESYGTSGAIIKLLGAAGTIATPTAVLAGSTLGGFNLLAHTGSAFTNNIARTAFVAEATVATGDAPTYLTFNTSADGAASQAVKVRLTSSGNLGIGTTSVTSKLLVNGQVDVNSNKLVNVATCTAGTDLANKNYVDNEIAGANKSAFQLKASATNATTTYATVVDATTPGVFYGFRVKNSNTSASSTRFKITIDGVVYEKLLSTTANIYYYPVDDGYFLWEAPDMTVDYPSSGSTTADRVFFDFHIEFKTLKVEIKSNGVTTATCQVLYGLD